jgi:uncharacterized repeat protein (TIGR01451 family)
MIKYVILFIALISNSLTAQKVIFSDAAFKSKLLTSSTDNAVARNLSGDYFVIDSNNNGEIEVQEAEQVTHLEVENASISSLVGIEKFTNLISLQCTNNQISNLDISSLKKLTDLNCNSNLLTVLAITGAVSLENLYCQSNLLESLNASNLTNLIFLECSQNKLKSLVLVGLINLQSLVCSGNTLTSLDVNDLTSIVTLECSNNNITTFDFSKIVNIETLSCSYNQLSKLDVSTLVDLSNFDCTDNQLSTINVAGLSRLSNFNCSNNAITILSINSLLSLINLNCRSNSLTSLNVLGLAKLKVLDCSRNQITALDLFGLTSLQTLFCTDNQIKVLNANNQTAFQSLEISNNLLIELYIKNGSNEGEGFLALAGNPTLRYICADEAETNYVLEQVGMNNYNNVEINSYCTVFIGGYTNILEGKNRLDTNSNGCDQLDNNFPYLKLNITADSSTISTIVPDQSGAYSYGVKAGSYTITPVLENPNYYTISPATTSAVFTNVYSPFSADFCISPKGIFRDLEVIILPLDSPQSNLESKYKIIYKNKGTLAQSGDIKLMFDATALNLIAANPNLTSQSLGVLNWNFTNLLPQETRSILVSFKVNSAIKDGYFLNYIVNILNTTDTTPIDNYHELRQTVVNTMVSNSKICLQGNSISKSKVGDYLYYMVRFENSGNAAITSLVVKDLIDISKFDINTLVPMHGSHTFSTIITNSATVEFIFENINLPFDKGNNIGYVVFKIKTLANLEDGAVITNVANIYFDYNQAILTNTASTSIQNLKIQDHFLSESVIVFPNPVKNVLNIQENSRAVISSINIYNMLGQLVQTQLNSDGNINAVDVSKLKNGLYFIRISTASGIATSKFLKE